MHIVIHTLPRPLLTQILPTRHIITLTKLVCQIGLIRINTCPSLNTMNKTEIIITTLHRVNENTTLPSHIVNHLTNIWLQYSFSRSTIRRINWLEKENGSLKRAWAMNSKSWRLIISSKFLSQRSLLYFSRRTYRFRKEYEIYDSISKWSFQYGRSKT